jgi:hypothetical protein
MRKWRPNCMAVSRTRPHVDDADHEANAPRAVHQVAYDCWVRIYKQPRNPFPDCNRQASRTRGQEAPMVGFAFAHHVQSL